MPANSHPVLPTLFYRPGACALAPHILLYWTGLDHIAHHAQRDDPQLLAINPSGAVPAFRTADGRGLTQAAAILQHIAVSAVRAELLGADDPVARDEIAMWMSFFTGDFHPAFWPYFAPSMYTTEPSDAHLSGICAASYGLIRTGLAKIDNRLEGRDWFVGHSKTAVDAYAIPMLRWAKAIEPVGFDDFANARRFYARVVENDGVRVAMRVQGIAP